MTAHVIEVLTLAPRVISESAAARYCLRSVAEFKREFPYPAIVYQNGDKGYDVRDLDRWIDSLKAGGGTSAQDALARLRAQG